jgi:glycosyltransferase involved in cell wall biosynthesis
VLRREAEGPAAARNAGAAAATGELLGFLDADDLATPERLALQGGILEAEPELDAVFGRLEEFLSPDRPELAERVAVRREPRPGLHAGAMLVRRALYTASPMDPRLHGAEFLDWFHRARAEGLRWRMLDEVVMRRRVHGGNMTLAAPAVARGYLGAARAAILRQRGGAP